MVWHDMNWYDMMQWMGSNLIQNTWITQAATGCQRRKGPGCQPQPTHPLAGAPATRWWLHLVAYIEMMTSHGFESMAQLGKMTEQKGGWTAITAWFPAAQVGWAISIFYNHHLSTILSKFHFCLSNCSFQVIASAATNIGYLRITPLGYMITQKIYWYASQVRTKIQNSWKYPFEWCISWTTTCWFGITTCWCCILKLSWVFQLTG